MGPKQEDLPGVVVFMTAPEAQMRLPKTGIQSKGGADTRDLAAVLERSTLHARPMFGSNQDRLAAVAGTQLDNVGIDIPDLSGFYRVRSASEPLADLAAELRSQEGVTAAWVEPIGEPPVFFKGRVKPNLDPLPVLTPDFSSQQGYLEAAPGGVDARYAWTLAGGGGASVRIFDVELGGWQFTHEDLGANQGGTIGNAGDGMAANAQADRSHATAVVGELGGDRNRIGILGVAPEASVRGAFTSVDGVAAAIRAATDLLGFGDLIIVEAHAAGPRFNFKLADPKKPRKTDGFIPMEWWESNYWAMRYAAAHGVIVLEAAGNGAENLDDDIYDTPALGFPKEWRNPFRRNERDSGAIVVGAGAPAGGAQGNDRSRLAFSNYGSMVDAQGWGGGVVTSGYGDLQGGAVEDRSYTRIFSGTSSALPIVAGALACVQGARSAHIFDRRLDGATARRLLRSTGTPQTDAPGRPSSQRIGNLPSIAQMLPGPVIYAVAHQRVQVDGPPTGGELWWYRHLGRRDGTASWAAGPRKLSDGWARVHAFGGGDNDGVIYTIAGNGDLHWRRHIGAGDGSNTWSPTVKIGNGWDFAHVFAARGGAIYAVKKFGIDPDTGRQLGGDLVMYDHLGWSDGTPRWNGEPKLVGTGWHFDHVVAGDEGRIYAITHNGELWRYIHTGRGVRSNQWELPEQIGRHWHFKQVFYGGDQVIYAIDASGDLWWDRDDGTKGPLSGPPTKKVGNGWDFTNVIAS